MATTEELIERLFMPAGELQYTCLWTSTVTMPPCGVSVRVETGDHTTTFCKVSLRYRDFNCDSLPMLWGFPWTQLIEKRLKLRNEQESPLDGNIGHNLSTSKPLKIWFLDWITNVPNVLNAHQVTFGSQWLKVLSYKNLGLKGNDQQHRISNGLRLGANICVAHTCHRGKRVEQDSLHGLSCTKSAGRFSRHVTLNSLKSRYGDLSSCLQCSNSVKLIELMANTKTVGCHGCGCSCTLSSESRLLMPPENHRHWGEVLRIIRQWIHF